MYNKDISEIIQKYHAKVNWEFNKDKQYDECVVTALLTIATKYPQEPYINVTINATSKDFRESVLMLEQYAEKY